MFAPRFMIAAAGIALLPACTAEDSADADPPTPVTQADILSSQDGGTDEAEAADGSQPQLKRSAWRSLGEDGAVFATYLDSDNRYRDFRNGEPDQQGGWQRREGGTVCFVPDGDNVRSDCWELGRADNDGIVIATHQNATHQNGREIELQKIEYRPPEDSR